MTPTSDGSVHESLLSVVWPERRVSIRQATIMPIISAQTPLSTVASAPTSA